MRKTYVIDTSALIYNPTCYEDYPNSEIIIPVSVLNELDKLKTFPDDAGKNARVCIRKLDALSNTGEIHKGITLENKSLLRIVTKELVQKSLGDENYVDNRILSCALALKKKSIIVSRDINLRIRAKSLGLGAEKYENSIVNYTDFYSGYITIVDSKLGNALKDKGVIDARHPELKAAPPNEGVHFKSEDGSGICLGRKVGDRIQLVQSKKLWGLEARSMEQAFAIDLLLDPKVSLVSLVGSAGGGKSLLAIAAALELVIGQKKFPKISIFRPIQPMGKDLGYLPGDLNQKIAVWQGASWDALELLLKGHKNDRWRAQVELWQEHGILNFEAQTYVRGRTIDGIIIIDECQQNSVAAIKTLITRCGSNAKVILTGDVSQIDNKQDNLDIENNGLTHVIEKFKPSALAGSILFTKVERSALAAEAVELL